MRRWFRPFVRTSTPIGTEEAVRATRKSATTKGKKAGGPYLAAAVFCDQILEEKPADEKSTAGIVSAIRIYDAVNVEFPANLPAGEKAAAMLNCLIILRTTTAPSKHTVNIVWIRPNGKKQKLPDTEIKFPKKGQASFQVKARLGVAFEEGGTHIFDVLLDGRRITSMPLLVSLKQGPSAHQS